MILHPVVRIGRLASSATPPIDSLKQGIAHLAPRFMIPSVVGSTGAMMLVPTLPLFIRQQSSSLTLVTLVLAAAPIGAVVAGVPAGRLIDRHGERRGFIGGLALGALGTAALALGGGLLAAFFACFVAGFGQSARLLANQSYTRNALTASIRGRVMSLLGGGIRVSTLVGPLIGGALAQAVGFESTFIIAGVLGAAGVLPAMIVPASGYRTVRPTGRKPSTTSEVVRTHMRMLGLAGTGQFGAAAVRFGRLALVPLYGQTIGLDAGEIGFAIAVASGVDFALFPVAGWLMDVFGRLYAIVPSFLLMSGGLFMLPLTHSLLPFTVVGAVIGVGNGLGSGTMLTLSVDLAPAANPARFLGVLRMLSDSGRILGTILVGAVADKLSLGASSLALGVVGIATAALFGLLIGETRSVDKPAEPIR